MGGFWPGRLSRAIAPETRLRTFQMLPAHIYPFQASWAILWQSAGVSGERLLIPPGSLGVFGLGLPGACHLRLCREAIPGRSPPRDHCASECGRLDAVVFEQFSDKSLCSDVWGCLFVCPAIDGPRVTEQGL